MALRIDFACNDHRNGNCLGRADSWLVVAAWDLTPVEQAVLAGRL